MSARKAASAFFGSFMPLASAALAQASTTGDRLRGVAQLIADVTEFMTLQPGDVLSLGRSHGAPLVRVGQRVLLEVEGLAPLHHRVVAEDALA